MPRIPQVTEASVEIQRPANARVATGGVNADAFGAGQGESLQKLGGVITQVGVVMEKQREQKAVSDGMDAYNDLQEASLSKRIELEKRMGKDADGIEKEYSEWYNQKRQEIGGKLNQPESVALFDRNANKLGLSNRSWSANYEQNQMNVYHDATMKTSVANAENSALLDPSLENYTQSMSDIRSYYRDMAVRRGFDEGWIDANVRQSEHKIQRDVLSNAMDQDSASGVSGYLEQFGDKLDPTLRGKAEKWLHNKYIDESSGAYADTLIASGVGIEDAITGAMERFQGEDRDKYVSAIKQRYALREFTKNAEEKQLTEKLYADVYKNPLGIASLGDEQIDNVAQYNPKLAIDLKNKKLAYLDVLAKGGQFAEETDADTNLSLTNDILDGKVKDVNQLTVYRGKLSENDYKKAKTLIEKQGLLNEADADTAYRNLFPKPKEKDGDAKRYDDLVRRAQFMTDAAAYVKETHRSQDLAGFAANWALKGKVPIEGSGFEFGGKRYFERSKTVTAGEAAAAGDAGSFTPDKPLERDALTASYIDNINNAASQKQKQNDAALEQKAIKKLMDAGQPVTAQRVQKLVDDMKAAQ